VPALTVDYLELRDCGLGPAPAHGCARLLVAARLGSTRLLDNIEMQIETPAGTAGPDGNHEYAQSPWRK
jgi:pantoate--beta-alanine ligase